MSLCLSVCRSVYLSFSICYLPSDLSTYLQARENAGISRNFFQIFKVASWRKKLFCKASLNLEASLRTKLLCKTSLQLWHWEVETAAFLHEVLTVSIWFVFFGLYVSTALRLPQKGDARSYEILHLSRNASTTGVFSSWKAAPSPQNVRIQDVKKKPCVKCIIADCRPSSQKHWKTQCREASNISRFLHSPFSDLVSSGSLLWLFALLWLHLSKCRKFEF